MSESSWDQWVEAQRRRLEPLGARVLVTAEIGIISIDIEWKGRMWEASAATRDPFAGLALKRRVEEWNPPADEVTP